MNEVIPEHINNDDFWQSIEQTPKRQKLIERIDHYLELGGLFNPELMNHVAVRDLLIDIRDELRTN